jgi:hypothetical protein
MRQGQQNRRGRGRSGGRKPQNPLARNYESNGPDVKIRGTAAHIAEKYMSLARDALSSGDIVAAESYLQHAEHYNRIIMAAQQQLGPQHGQPSEGPNGGGMRSRWHSDDDSGDDDGPEAGGGEPRSGEPRSGEARGGEPRGGDVRDARGPGGQDRDRPDRERQGGGGQDRERHAGDREHHGGRDNRRRGANGSESGRDANGSDQPETHQPDETAPDQVS